MAVSWYIIQIMMLYKMLSITVSIVYIFTRKSMDVNEQEKNLNSRAGS
jgi:hypothetical protein